MLGIRVGCSTSPPDKSIFFGGGVQSEPGRIILSPTAARTSSRGAASRRFSSTGRSNSVKILAIETSVRAWSIALSEGESTVVQPAVDHESPISRTLLTSIQSAVRHAGWTMRQIELIAVSQGPGAFTGLRVGITAAKTLAYALGCPMVACNSLEVIAAATAQSLGWPTHPPVRVVMDAQRSEFFVGLFQAVAAWELVSISTVSIMGPSQLGEAISAKELLTGPALAKWEPPTHANVAAPEYWTPSAVALSRLALHRFRQGFSSDPFSLVPEYHRPTYADEKRSS